MTDGCQKQSSPHLGVLAEEFERVRLKLERVPEQVIRSAVLDRPVQAAAARWSECLAGTGWDIATPDGLRDALAPEIAAADSGPAARAELARRESELRIDDTRCRDTSGLQGALDRAFDAHGARVAAENAEALQAHRRMLDHAARVTGE